MHPFNPPPELLNECERQAKMARYHAAQIKALIETTRMEHAKYGWAYFLYFAVFIGGVFLLIC